MKYQPKAIEGKWQKRWEEEGVFRCPDEITAPKFYCLEMFPYPSGRIHMGHVRVYTIGDLIARFKRMRGFQVLHPIGWDAFGLPAENAAHRHATHPARWTWENIGFMRQQLRELGISYDWDREFATCSPDYYRWEQLFFLWMLEDGLAYRKRAQLNWCDECQTVLANEQVNRDGTCFIHDQARVTQRELDQWFVGITKYAEELLSGHEELRGRWPDNVLEMQRNWIGRSEGAEVDFPLEDGDGTITVFTTRPDTVCGATFMSMAPEHPLVLAFARKAGREGEVREFVRRVALQDKFVRSSEESEKEGIFTGGYCRNPLTGGRIPIYAANFVLAEYGTGAVMAVPAHDQRDFEFARKYGLPVVAVIQPDGEELSPDTMSSAFEGPGRMVGSGPFTGMPSEEGKRKITAYFEEKGIGKGKVQYRLRDWGVSRQRYWGCPIPVIHCPSCGVVPVPVRDLPVVLPEDLPYTREKGNPLAGAEDWIRVPCPSCGGPARRETDTFDTFFESSWYFLRYIDPKNDREPLDPKKMGNWMPVDQYIGGVEHACMHLIYARFFHKFLRDRGLAPGNEPFRRLLSQGMVCMQTMECPKHGWRYPEEVDAEGKCGQCGEKVTVGRSMKMSKSKRNVVEPSLLIERYGADTARLFSLFASPPEKDLDWSEQGVEGAFRFLGRVYRLIVPRSKAVSRAGGTPDESAASRRIRRVTHRTLRKVTGDVEERYHFNTAISAIMEMVNFLYLVEDADWESPGTAPALAEAVEMILLMLSPFAPHLSEELWEGIGKKGLVSAQPWPRFDAEVARSEEILVVVQINGKLRSRITVDAEATEEEIRSMVMTDPRVREYTEGKAIRKMVYVPKKLVSIVL
ncbi:MAG: leucyl-tRNA synthetase, leucyl-tRNA synthetase [Deltaproteobacteria bacterium CSP1-8]|nr:MAG: leucyl-tRNA synthetase, leucyl-tRNA synthetase [Deltaproteobacteria bacterium CSP1-8]